MKILVLGDSNVGKTSVIKRYAHNVYGSHYQVGGFFCFARV